MSFDQWFGWNAPTNPKQQIERVATSPELRAALQGRRGELVAAVGNVAAARRAAAAAALAVQGVARPETISPRPTSPAAAPAATGNFTTFVPEQRVYDNAKPPAVAAEALSHAVDYIPEPVVDVASMPPSSVPVPQSAPAPTSDQIPDTIAAARDAVSAAFRR